MDKYKATPWTVFSKIAQKYSHRVSIIDKGNILTYQDMLDKINDFSSFISKLDFSICGVFLPNSHMFISSMLALSKLNKVFVPLSFQLKGESLLERVNFSDMEVIITDNNGFKEIEAVRNFINIKYVIVIGEFGENVIHEFQCKFRIIDQKLEDVFGIFFTSGSTSKPKGVVISNKAIVGNVDATAEYLDFECTDRYLISRPFPQAGPISGEILMTFSRGAELVILNDLFYPAIVLKAIQEYKITTTTLVSTMLNQLLNYPQLNKFDISSLKRIVLAGMATPISVIEKTLLKIPEASLYNAYGMTENSVRIAFLGPNEIINHPKSVGKPLRGCSVKIFNKNGKEAEANEKGEIYVVSDYMANGYYKELQLTRDTMTSRGLRTRDMGYKDEDGLLYIVGRSDDLIIQGGNNVYPTEIQEVLLRNSNIKEAEVFGIDDEKLGSKIVTMICVREGCTITSQEVYKWCRLNLEDKKIPKEIYIVGKIPKSDTGKVSKRALKEYVNNLNLSKGK